MCPRVAPQDDFRTVPSLMSFRMISADWCQAHEGESSRAAHWASQGWILLLWGVRSVLVLTAVPVGVGLTSVLSLFGSQVVPRSVACMGSEGGMEEWQRMWPRELLHLLGLCLHCRPSAVAVLLGAPSCLLWRVPAKQVASLQRLWGSPLSILCPTQECAEVRPEPFVPTTRAFSAASCGRPSATVTVAGLG